MKEKIQCALCAYGMSGKVFHGPLISSHPNLNLYGVLERKTPRAYKDYPGIKRYQQLDDMLDDSTIDLVVVNVPDHLHTDFVRQALLAGKHVICEKPFTLKSEDAQDLIVLANQVNRKVWVFHNRRWDSDFLTVRSLIDSGTLGQVAEYEARYDRYRPVPAEGSWKENSQLGTGLLYNLGSHLIDQALVLFGWPDSVFADIAIMRKGGKVTDYFSVLLFYPCHRVHLKSSYLVMKAASKYQIQGTEGSFIKNGHDPQEERLASGWTAKDPEIGREEPEFQGTLYSPDHPGGHPITSAIGSYYTFYQEIVNELYGSKGKAVQATEALQVIRIIEAALLSKETGQRVSIRNV